MTAPDISVVVVASNSSRYLVTLFRSLEPARTSYSARQEVILVDDSTTREEQERTARLCAEYNVRLLPGVPSVNVKRNMGGQEARYPVLLFLDSDCIASPDLLQQYSKSYEAPDVQACLGLVRFVGEKSWLWRSVELSPYLFPFDFARYHKTIAWGTTANFSVRKDAFLSVGGFNTQFPARPGGEDVDLGLRLTESGVVIHCNGDAVVEHTRETWNTLNAMIHRLSQWGRAEYHLMKDHPKYLKHAFPRFSVLLFLVTALCALLGLVTRRPQLLLLPLVWGAVFLLANTVFTAFRHARGWPDLRAQLVTQFMLLSFEWGVVGECIRRRRPRLLLYHMIYTPGQMTGEWYYGGIRAWATTLSTFSLFVVLFFGV